MRLPVNQARSVACSLAEPPVLMLLGLIVLVMEILWPSTPVVAAVALVGLGATIATAQRLRPSPVRGPLFAVHLALYGSLYLLFVGATLDAAARSGEGLSPLAVLDLTASLGPLAAAICVAVGALRDVGRA